MKPPLIVVPVAVPPETTIWKPPSITVVLLASAPEKVICWVPLERMVPIVTPLLFWIDPLSSVVFDRRAAPQNVLIPSAGERCVAGHAAREHHLETAQTGVFRKADHVLSATIVDNVIPRDPAGQNVLVAGAGDVRPARHRAREDDLETVQRRVVRRADHILRTAARHGGVAHRPARQDVLVAAAVDRGAVRHPAGEDDLETVQIGAAGRANHILDAAVRNLRPARDATRLDVLVARAGHVQSPLATPPE